MWGQINGADGRAATEGSAAMQQAKTLVVFDKADGDRIRQSLLDYLREADAEWPVVAHGQTYPAADAALQDSTSHTNRSSSATRRNTNSSLSRSTTSTK